MSDLTLILLLVMGFTTHQGLTRYDVMARYLFSVEAIRLRGQWYRFVSSAFLHVNWWHFAANAITLYFFGGELEKRFGSTFFLGTFFLSVLGGHGVSYLLHRQGDYRSVGASGGVLGLLFASVFLAPGMSIFLFPLPLPIPAWLYAVGFLLYTVYGLKSGSGSIGHEAHFGGALTGVLIVLLQYPALALQQPWLLLFVLFIGIGGLWYVHANPARVPGFLRFRLRALVKGVQHRQSAQENEEIDRILDKVSREGIQTLTERERKLLQSASRKRGGGR